MDSQGYYGYDDTEKAIIIVFQGSVSIRNWILDAMFIQLDFDYPGVVGARVHGGFLRGAESLYDLIIADVRTLLRTKPGYKLVVTGHSLGAAHATLVSLLLRDSEGIEPEVQTYGEPRVGNRAFANYWNQRINKVTWRFSHNRDPVVQIPFQVMLFHHRAKEVFLKNRSGNNYQNCDASGEDPDCANSVAFAIDILDHIGYFGTHMWIPCL